VPSVPIFVVMSLNMATTFAAAPLIAAVKAEGRFRLFLGWQTCQILFALAGYLLAMWMARGFEMDSWVGLGTERALAVMVAMVNWCAWGVALPIVARIAGLSAGASEFLRDTGVIRALVPSALMLAPALGVAWVLERTLPLVAADSVTALVVAPAFVIIAVLRLALGNADLAPLIQRFARGWLARPLGWLAPSGSGGVRR
jgi:hypothetical protein